MDDLLRFVRHEVAMDGDDGTPVNRLDDFLHAFYAQEALESGSSSGITQNIDDAFRDFVWKQLAGLPELTVAYLKPLASTSAAAAVTTDGGAEEPGNEGLNGTESGIGVGDNSRAESSTPALPPSIPIASSSKAVLDEAGVPITPAGLLKASQKKQLKAERGGLKGRNSRDARLENAEQFQFVEVSQEEVQSCSREELKERYGDSLRIAADPETCYVALTGSHDRHGKLTQLAYQVLQAIARGRDEGKTVVELGREFEHDQKSLFHFVKSLVELNLIVKLKVLEFRSQTSRCIHRHYLATSQHWVTAMARDPTIKDSAKSAGDKDEEEDDDAASTEQLSIMTIAHLNGNEQFVKSRILRALRNAPENIIPHVELVFAIGFRTRPPKIHRRRLNRIVDQLLRAGMIEKVGLARGGARGLQSCLKLVENPVPTGEDGQEPLTASASDPDELEQRPNLLLTVPFERQVLDLMVAAGAQGVTIRELQAGCGDVGVRSLETLLTRFEKGFEPPHLCDYRIQSVLETFGREKRLRYFTVSGYHERCRLDGLGDLPNKMDFSHPHLAGEFAQLETTGFYSTPAEYEQYCESLYTGIKQFVKKGGKKVPRDPTKPVKLGRPKGSTKAAKLAQERTAAGEGEETLTVDGQAMANGEGAQGAPAPRKKIGRPKKPRPEGEEDQKPPKKGRPRKEKPAEEGEAGEGPPKKKPRKSKTKDTSAVPEGDTGVSAAHEHAGEPTAPVSVPPEGDVSMVPTDVDASVDDSMFAQRTDVDATETAAASSTTPKGRPRKRPLSPTHGPDGEPLPPKAPPIKGRPRKYPVGTTAAQRKVILEERRASGLEPAKGENYKRKKDKSQQGDQSVAPDSRDVSMTETPGPTEGGIETPAAAIAAGSEAPTGPEESVAEKARLEESAIPAVLRDVTSQPHVNGAWPSTQAAAVDVAEATGNGEVSQAQQYPPEIPANAGNAIQQLAHSKDAQAEAKTTTSAVADLSLLGEISTLVKAAEGSGQATSAPRMPAAGQAEEAVQQPAQVPKKRGRPRKNPQDATPASAAAAATTGTNASESTAPVLPLDAAADDSNTVPPSKRRKTTEKADGGKTAPRKGGRRKKEAEPTIVETAEVEEPVDGVKAEQTATDLEPEDGAALAATSQATESVTPAIASERQADSPAMEADIPPVKEGASQVGCVVPILPAQPPPEKKKKGRPRKSTITEPASTTVVSPSSDAPAVHQVADFTEPRDTPSVQQPPAVIRPLPPAARPGAPAEHNHTSENSARAVDAPDRDQGPISQPVSSEDFTISGPLNLPAMPEPLPAEQQSVPSNAEIPIEDVVVTPNVLATAPADVSAGRDARANERLNHSMHIHENEYHALLQELGGIAEEGVTLHRLWQEFMQRREPDKPAPRILDRRTFKLITSGLERRDLIRRSVLQVSGPNGKLFQRPIMYLATLSLNSPEMRNFAVELEKKEARGSSRKWLTGRQIIDKTDEIQVPSKKKKVETASDRLDQQEEELLRDPRAFFAATWRVVAQYYGWQHGFLARSRTLHEHLVRSITDDNESIHIVSSDIQCRIFATPYVLLDTPVNVYMRLSAISELSEELDAFLRDNDTTALTIKDVPAPIAAMYGAGKAKSSSRFSQLFDVLIMLRLLVPLDQTEQETPLVAYSGAEREPRYFKAVESRASATYWLLANQAPLYDLQERRAQDQRLLGQLPVRTPEEAANFWDTLHGYTFGHITEEDMPKATLKYPPTLEAPPGFILSTRTAGRWQSTYLLTALQKTYLKRLLKTHDFEEITGDLQKLQEVAHNVCAPPDAVQAYLSKARDEPKEQWQKRKRTRAGATQDASDSSASDGEGLKAPPPRSLTKSSKKKQSKSASAKAAERESARLVIAKKAKAASDDKEAIWRGLLNGFRLQYGDIGLEAAQLDFLHSWFVAPGGPTAAIVREHLDQAISLTGATIANPAPETQKKPRLGAISVPNAALSASKATLKTKKKKKTKRAKKLDAVSKNFDLSKLPELAPIESSGEAKTAGNGWTLSEDEQLEDFYIILQTRANEHGTKLTVEPIRHFYKGATNKLITDRLRRLAAQPGHVTYLDDLLDVFTKLWQQGKIVQPELQQAMRSGTGNHLVLLRRLLHARINKQALRLQSLLPKDAAAPAESPLPADPSDIEAQFILKPSDKLKKMAGPKAWSYLWSMTTTAQKSLVYQQQAHSTPFDELEEEQAPAPPQSSQDRLAVFNQRLQKVQGSMHDQLKDAHALEKRLATEGGMEWPVICEDGDMIAYTHLFSENLLEFTLDTSVTRAGRPYTDYRTRKVDDHSFENILSVAIKASYAQRKTPIIPDPPAVLF